MIVTAIIPAAGEGSRFRGAVRKQFIALDGLPILSHTLRALAASNALAAAIVVVPPGEESFGREALSLAGGVTDRGATGRVRVVRLVDGEEREMRVELGDQVQPGDTVIVPERFF